jgi:hypothetical protein
MNNQKNYQDEDSSYKNSISKHSKAHPTNSNGSLDNVFRIHFTEMEPSSSIYTVEPIHKQIKFTGKKRKRNEENRVNTKDSKNLTTKEFQNTLDDFDEDFKQLGIARDSHIEKKSSVNLGVLLLFQNIFDYLRLDSNRLNKTIEGTFIKDGISDTNIKNVLSKLKTTKDKRLADLQQSINRYSNIDLVNSNILELFEKILNYFDKKINVCDFEYEAINWKYLNLFNTSEKISSHRNVILNKTKKVSSIEKLYDNVISRSLIYLLNRKGKADSELIEYLQRTNEVFDKKYVSNISPKYLNQIESIYEDSDKGSNIIKYMLSLVQFINSGKELPDDYLYSVFDKEFIEKKNFRKFKPVETKNILCESEVTPVEEKKPDVSILGKNIIKIDTSAFLDNKVIEKKIQEEKEKLFKPIDCTNNNVLFNVNVNLNVNLNVNVTNNQNRAKNTIIKIDYDSINKQINNLPDDDAVTITDSDKTISVNSVRIKSKKKNKIFMVSKVKRDEFSLMQIKNINFEIRPTLKKNRKSTTNSIINN